MSQTFTQYLTLIGGLDPVTATIYSKIDSGTPIISALSVAVGEEAQSTWLSETGLPVTSTRALNGTVTGTVGDNDTITKLYGHIASLVELDVLFNSTEKEDQINKQGRSATLFINNQIWKGDTGVDANGFDGIEKYTIDNGKVITQTAAALSIGSLDEAIIEMEEQLPDAKMAFYMNSTIFKRFQAAQRAGLLGHINLTPNEAGIFILTYNGIPLRLAGKLVDGTQVLDFDEGTGVDETSIYLVDEREESIRLQLHNPQPVRIIEKEFSTNYPININMLLQQRESSATFRISDILDLPIVA